MQRSNFINAATMRSQAYAKGNRALSQTPTAARNRNAAAHEMPAPLGAYSGACEAVAPDASSLMARIEPQHGSPKM
jgi:hypothetical protein